MSETATTLRIVIPGEPVPKGRPRFSAGKKKDGSAFARTYTPAATAAYEDKIKLLAQVAVNQTKWAWSDRDRFSIVIRIHRTHWDKGGDCDNYAKICLDALNRIAWSDDARVRGIGVALCEPDPKTPRVEIEIRRYAVTKPKRKRVA